MNGRRRNGASSPSTAAAMPDRAVSPWTAAEPPRTTPTIADEYADLLRYLSPAQRRGMISRLTQGYYEDWRPSRPEVADLVAVELGVLTWEGAAQRHRQRLSGAEPESITPQIRAWYRDRALARRLPRGAVDTRR